MTHLSCNSWTKISTFTWDMPIRLSVWIKGPNAASNGTVPGTS